MPRKVLITGASGLLGRKLQSHLASSCDLVLLDRNPADCPNVSLADLGTYDDAWVGLFRDVDTVVHLAGAGGRPLSWEELEPNNVDAVLNVFHAATKHGIRRVVFASTNHTMDGYREEEVTLTSDLPGKPVTMYAAAKLMGERIGKFYSDRHGLSVICLRIGWVRRGDNFPDPYRDLWEQQMWLSDRDFCQAIERAIEIDGVTFATVNLMSDNAGMRWDISETESVLGYQPSDRHVPVPLPFTKRMRRQFSLCKQFVLKRWQSNGTHN